MYVYLEVKAIRSNQSESDLEKNVEDVESSSVGKSSSSQGFYIGKNGKTEWQKKPLRTI